MRRNLRELRLEFVCARDGFSRKEFQMQLQPESEDAVDRAAAELSWERRKSDSGAPPSEEKLRRQRSASPPRCGADASARKNQGG
ncbi:hypothetical protein DIPPA_08740 [Diplonema papillatum]|nr:hypothetical protein DIPPA_08740 [Diplonema papillatum]